MNPMYHNNQGFSPMPGHPSYNPNPPQVFLPQPMYQSQPQYQHQHQHQFTDPNIQLIKDDTSKISLLLDKVEKISKKIKCSRRIFK